MSLKLLDYGKSHPFGEIVGKRRNLAWPVDAYRVTFPKSSDDAHSLNPFERVILRIINARGGGQTEDLARETCLPIDLVQCVLSRLQDKAFVDDHNQITKQKCQSWENEKQPAFVSALLFRELATGKILPFYHLLDDHHPLKRKDNEEKLFWQIGCAAEHRNKPPTPRDIISALRALKKRSRDYGGEPSLPAVQQITIAREPEQYYLDCPIAIQKSDGEVRIADPFGMGFSLVIENAFSRLLEQDNRLSDWLLNWKQITSNPRADNQAQLLREPYDNDVNQGRYPNLVSNLRVRRNTQYRTIGQIYAALEWALFYACAQRSFETAVNQLRIVKQAEHPALLKQAAEKVGLNVPQHGFRPVLAGRLSDFLSGKAEMGTLLSVALLVAEADPSHPLRRIAAQRHDFITQIFEIKSKRDDQGHGKGQAQRNESELPEEAFMRNIVTALLPSIRFSAAAVPAADKDAIADLLLDARTSIQGEFGFRLFNRLGTELQNSLIYAERFWLSCKDVDDARAFAWDIYAATQRAFGQRLLGVLPPHIDESEFTAKAQTRAKEHELGDLPECLRTVNPVAIRGTLQGENQTLGACVVAFLLTSDTDILRAIAAGQPSFLLDVADIIIRRGHGNEPLPMTKGAIGKLRRATYSTIKTLLEI